MQIILLSGGSGRRLWPLSNETRSKQFLRLLPAPGGGRESMVQRIVRQIGEAGLGDGVTFATSASQEGLIMAQTGGGVSVVTEPERRDTFPAIALSAAHLSLEAGCPPDETVVVMPCDPFTDSGYFDTLRRMASAVQAGAADLVLMGVRPDCPSSKFGYIVPEGPAVTIHGPVSGSGPGVSREVSGHFHMYKVSRFTEKPDTETAGRLIASGAFWNGGVFAFRLGYMMDILRRYVSAGSFAEVYSRYSDLPKRSFDYEVAEKASSVAVVPFEGEWKDLGTWNALTGELGRDAIGNALVTGGSAGTSVVNELDIPVLCVGTRDLVVAASYDGILVSDREASEGIRGYADSLSGPPMYGEFGWGGYRTLDRTESPDGITTLTRRVTVRPGCRIGSALHRGGDLVWTFVSGSGRATVDGAESGVGRGDVVRVPAGAVFSLFAVNELSFIEIQSGHGQSDYDYEPFTPSER